MKLLTLPLILLSLSCGSTKIKGTDSGCIANRTAWDFGSGTIKVKSAKVDLCNQKIIQTFYHKSKKINFKEDLDKSRSKKISQKSKAKAEAFIQKVLSELTSKSLHAGVATAAFREAKNSKSFIKEINQKYNLNLKVISQEEEAQIGLQSVKSQIKKQTEDFVVWDIGGGSQQISIKAKNKVTIYKSPWASVSFKNLYLSQIKKNKYLSPNPMGLENFNKATSSAKALARFFKMPADLEKFKTVYGIGGVHGASLGKKLKTKSYTKKDLRKIAKDYINKNDNEIGGKYASTDVTNIALVLGTMKALKINNVRIIKAGLVEGLLLKPGHKTP